MQSGTGLAGTNGLSKNLRDRLAVTHAVFDFGIDIQTNAYTQPVEDPTICWSTQKKCTRREWVAVITIPRQEVDTHSALAEMLAFSPWQALKEHEPLGAISRARLPTYRNMAKRRHELNGVVPADSSEVP